jgi:hypothetical protein
MFDILMVHNLRAYPNPGRDWAIASIGKRGGADIVRPTASSRQYVSCAAKTPLHMTQSQAIFKAVMYASYRATAVEISCFAASFMISFKGVSSGN